MEDNEIIFISAYEILQIQKREGIIEIDYVFLNAQKGESDNGIE